MATMGLLLDWEYCTGCHSCEIACKHEKGLGIGDWGMKIAEIKPFQHQSGEWDWIYLPTPTKACDLCESRVEGGESPACVLHCLADVLRFGPIGELAELAESKGTGKCAIFVP